MGTKLLVRAYNVGCGMLRALHAGYPVPLWEVPVPGRQA